MYHKAFIFLILVAMIYTFLAVGPSFAELREKRGFQIFQHLFLAIGVALSLFWANYVFQNTHGLASEYLRVARNYERDKNTIGMLEYALKAHQTSPTSPEVLSYLGYAYILQHDDQSLLKGRELLTSNFHRLDETGKATLGTIENYSKNYGKAFQLLSPLDFANVAENILPWSLAALSAAAFETLPYDEALLRSSDALVHLDRRLALYEVKVATSSTAANVTWYPFSHARLRAPKLYIGKTWLAKAYAQGNMEQLPNALKVANEGFESVAIVFSIIPKEEIVKYLSVFNHVIMFSASFAARNQELILTTIAHYVKSLQGAKSPSYEIELQKLKLLHNCLVDVHSIPKEKWEISLAQPIHFTVHAEFSDDSTVKTVTLEKNFASPQPVTTNELPAKKMQFKRRLNLSKDRTLGKAEDFGFVLSAADMTGNKTTWRFCPNFFQNQIDDRHATFFPGT
jgi:hypothetical protein